MGYLPLIRKKAAHFVTDLTTVILNPISDQPSKPPDEHGTTNPESEVKDEEHGTENPESEDLDGHIESTNGPDTSSFTAFLVSLMSSSDSCSKSQESSESNGDNEDKDSGKSVAKETNRKSILSKGKHTLGKALQKAAKFTIYRQNSETKVDHVMRNDVSVEEHELKPLEVINDDELKLNLPEISEPSMLLSESLRGSLYVSLPVLVQGRKWVLLYSTWRHGISLSTLYRRSMLCPGYTLMVVGDQKGAVFGGLLEAPLVPTNKKYQGTNSSFVFRNLSSHLDIFRPTGVNHYYTLCATDFLALGGGGHFALYLDGDLLSGSSSTSETYGNSCLAHTPEFEIKEVELWAFVYASQYEEMIELCRTEKPGICRW